MLSLECVCVCAHACVGIHACVLPWQQCSDGGEGTHHVEEGLGHLQGLHPQGVGGGAAAYTPHAEQQGEDEVEDATTYQHCNVHPHLGKHQCIALYQSRRPAAFTRQMSAITAMQLVGPTVPHQCPLKVCVLPMIICWQTINSEQRDYMIT